MLTNYLKTVQDVKEKAHICGRQPDEITIIAVSKGCTLDTLLPAYQEGARNFGESRVQESLTKMVHMPADCNWHMIGTLQKNKVSTAVSRFNLIHSVDSLELAKKISETSRFKSKITSILLQVNTSGEKTKHGLSETEWERHLDQLNELSNMHIKGLMTIAPLIGDEKVIRNCFKKLYHLREKWKGFLREPELFVHLSMGMSHDYPIAIEEGATLLRIGSAIFDTRPLA